jgi:hypothetical protein
MAFGTPLLKIGSLIGVAILGGSLASNPMRRQSCVSSSTQINLAAQQAVKARLQKLYFPIFYYSADDHTSVSNDQCSWTVLGHVEAKTNDGATVRLGWAVELIINPRDPRGRPTVASSITF